MQFTVVEDCGGIPDLEDKEGEVGHLSHEFICFCSHLL